MNGAARRRGRLAARGGELEGRRAQAAPILSYARGPPNLPHLPSSGVPSVGVHEPVHLADQRRVQDFVFGIRMDVEVNAAVEAGVFDERRRAVVDSVSAKVLAEALDHALGRAERAAVGADDFLAVERDFAVVVGDHDEPTRWVAH